MKLLTIYTGGTIGMQETDKGLQASNNEAVLEVLQQYPNYKKHQVDCISFKEPIDSSQFHLGLVKELLFILKENYNKYDAFLILMGTDAMAYVSALVSKAIQGLQKMIVFTGGMLPITHPKTDSKDNLFGSLKMIEDYCLNSDFHGVSLYFNHQLFAASGVTKLDTSSLNAFAAESRYCIAKLENDVIHQQNTIPKDYREFKIQTDFTSKIGVLIAHPFIQKEEILASFNVEKYHAVVVQLLGSGTIPKRELFLKEIESYIQQRGKVFVISQCKFGGLHLGDYQESNGLIELGVQIIEEGTLESALALALVSG